MSTTSPADSAADLAARPDGDEIPVSLTPTAIRRRLVEKLTNSWPRLAYAGAADELAEVVMDVVAPVVDRLHEAVRDRRRHTAGVLEQRDRARALAAALEQVTAEAERLLSAGKPGPALAVLRGDGQPPEPCAGHGTDGER